MVTNLCLLTKIINTEAMKKEIEKILKKYKQYNKGGLIHATNELLSLFSVMPRLICINNEREGGYLTVGRTYEAESINADGFYIKDDSGDMNVYSTAYLNVV